MRRGGEVGEAVVERDQHAPGGVNRAAAMPVQELLARHRRDAAFGQHVHLHPERFRRDAGRPRFRRDRMEGEHRHAVVVGAHCIA